MNENNNAYPVYYDPSIKDDNIIISGMQQCDFKCGDPLFLINIEKTATGKVSEIVDDRHPGFYVGKQIACQLAIDLDPWGDVIHVMKLLTPDKIDVAKPNHPSPNSLNIEFRTDDSDIHKVILEQMNFTLGKSKDFKKMNIAIYNHSLASENVAGIGINLNALEENPWAISEKIGMAVQAVVAKYLLDLKDLKKYESRGKDDNKTNENNKPYPVYPVYYDESIKDDNIVISIKDDNITIPGIKDFKCGNKLFLINLEGTVTGVVSEIVDDRNPGFYIGDQLASQLAIGNPGGDIIRVMEIPMISNHNNG